MHATCDSVTFAYSFSLKTSACCGGARSDVPTLLHALGYNPPAALMKSLVDEVWPCSRRMSRNLARFLFRHLPHTRTKYCLGLTQQLACSHCSCRARRAERRAACRSTSCTRWRMAQQIAVPVSVACMCSRYLVAPQCSNSQEAAHCHSFVMHSCYGSLEWAT